PVHRGPGAKALSRGCRGQIWTSVVGVTSTCVGAHWDISSHRSIGRDTFWTPPHLAIYLCGVLAGLTGRGLKYAQILPITPRTRRTAIVEDNGDEALYAWQRLLE